MSFFILAMRNNMKMGFIWIAMLSAYCTGKSPETPPPSNPCVYLGVDTCRLAAAVNVTIRPEETKQTIHSFGASDGWTCKFVGNWANVSKKQQAADYLFSLDTMADGSPKGIGLSLWRFNIGAGSYEQGENSNITDEWRREECFQNAAGQYDWNKQAGGRWFLDAARRAGVKYSLGFALTPPVHMSANGKAYASGGTAFNITAGKQADYADFLAAVSAHFNLDYLSPFNEPQWEWKDTNGKAGQEGSPARNDEMAAIVRLLSARLQGNTQVVIGEAGTWNYLYGSNTDGRGDQISQFFTTPTSPNYVGGLPHVASIISAHSYFTTCPDNDMVNVRRQVAAKAGSNLAVWQSEFGILGNICNLYNGSPRNTGIEYGLYVAKVLHYDLTEANVTSWQWWLAVSPYNYSDALVYINDPSGNINVPNSRTDGIVLDSRQLWSFGNFARFVRPGMQRVSASNDGGLLTSAYKDAAARKLVLVCVNSSAEERKLALSGFSGGSFDVYVTDALRNLKKERTGVVKAPPKSIITVVGAY
ncbi:glycoside hydrolase [Chitinophaga lutea]